MGDDTQSPGVESVSSDRQVSVEASRFDNLISGGRESVATLCEPDVPRGVVLAKISEALGDVGGDLPGSAVNMAKVYGQRESMGAITRFGAVGAGENFGLSGELSDDAYLSVVYGTVRYCNCGQDRGTERSVSQ